MKGRRRRSFSSDNETTTLSPFRKGVELGELQNALERLEPTVQHLEGRVGRLENGTEEINSTMTALQESVYKGTRETQRDLGVFKAQLANYTVAMQNFMKGPEPRKFIAPRPGSDPDHLRDGHYSTRPSAVRPLSIGQGLAIGFGLITFMLLAFYLYRRCRLGCSWRAKAICMTVAVLILASLWPVSLPVGLLLWCCSRFFCEYFLFA